MTDLVDKRFQVTLGLHVAPAGTPFQLATMCYGKLNYESMVQVQAIVGKYNTEFNEFMKPIIEELTEAGIAQAELVESERKGKKDKVPPGAMR